MLHAYACIIHVHVLACVGFVIVVVTVVRMAQACVRVVVGEESPGSRGGRHVHVMRMSIVIVLLLSAVVAVMLR